MALSWRLWHTVAAMWQRRVNERADTPHHEVAADHFIRNSAFLPTLNRHIWVVIFSSRVSIVFFNVVPCPPLSGRFSQARAGEGGL